MANTTGPTVRSLLPPKWRGMEEIVRKEMDQARWVRERRAPGMLVGCVGEQVTAVLERALDRNVYEYFVEAWRTAKEILACAEQSAREPGTTKTLFLGEHDLSTTVHPVVHVSIDGCCAFDIACELVLSAGFRTARLTMRDGALHAVDAGDCDVTVQLSYKGMPLHERLRSRKAPLGAPLRIDPPLPLVRASTPLEHRHG